MDFKRCKLVSWKQTRKRKRKGETLPKLTLAPSGQGGNGVAGHVSVTSSSLGTNPLAAAPTSSVVAANHGYGSNQAASIMKVYQHQGQGQSQGQEGSPPSVTAHHHPHTDHVKTEHAAMTGNCFFFFQFFLAFLAFLAFFPFICIHLHILVG